VTRKHRRLTLIGIAGLVLVAAAGLVLYALSDRIVFFSSPTDIVEKPIAAGTRIRLGGMVVAGSLMKQDDGHVRFDVSDGRTSIAVSYQGLLPDLFREGQGVVAEGVVNRDFSFNADTILAKHDERYMPPEVVDALKKAGRWGEGADTVIGSDAADGPPMPLTPPAAQ
jgi:cytochrome c-type biogenesis protein CcmE